MPITLYSPAGAFKAVALRRSDRLALAREAKPGDTLVICECDLPHVSMPEAKHCDHRIMNLIMNGTDAPEVEHGPMFDEHFENATGNGNRGRYL